MPERILVVDDDRQMQRMLREALTRQGFEVDVAPDAETALEKLPGEAFALVLLDIRLPGMSGLDALPRILGLDPQMPVIMITGHGNRQVAVQAIQAGAYDFFEKPFRMDVFTIVLRRALEKRALTREVHTLAERLDSRLQVGNMVGESPAMQGVFNLVSKVVPTDATVLISGQSGTGKELIAEAIHHNGPRRDQPFVKLNCTAIPDTLLESELFGHEQGAFTGATRRKLGKFELASGGTIFLDEIGDMSLATQAKILRVLQEREIDRVGGTEPIKVDVRIVAATNKDLAKAVEEGAFREDLYFRLDVFSIHLPSLRERLEDLPPLVERCVARFARKLGKDLKGFSPEAMNFLLAHDWPGNVRELENVVERAAVLAEEPVMGPDCLPSHLVSLEPRVPDVPTLIPGRALDDTLTEIEHRLIRDALRRTGGIQTRAARLLGISERSLWHRVRKLGIDVGDIKDAKPTPDD